MDPQVKKKHCIGVGIGGGGGAVAPPPPPPSILGREAARARFVLQAQYC